MKPNFPLIFCLIVLGTLLGLAIASFDVLVIGAMMALILLGTYLALLLRFPERGLWLLAAALPYERLGTVSLGLFTLKLGQVVTAFILAAWFARAAITGMVKFVYNPLRIPLLLFLAANVLSLINAVNVTRALALIGQLVVGILVYFVTINFLGRQNLKPTLVALWLGAALVCLFGLYQFVGDFIGLSTSVTGLSAGYSGSEAFGFARIQSVSLEPLYFANYLLLPILTAAAYLFGTKGKARWWLIPLLLLLLTVLVLTLARGAYLALFFSGIGLLIAFRREIFTPKVLLGSALAGLVVLLTVVALLISSGSSGENPTAAFTKQVNSIGQDVSSQQRIGTTQAAERLFPEHPVIGLGIGNFGEYYQDPLTTDASKTHQVVHNTLLETLVETGLVGLLSLLLIFVVLFERTIRAWRRVGDNPTLRAALAGAGLALLAILIQAQTFSALYLMHVWFSIGLLVAVQNMIIMAKRKPA